MSIAATDLAAQLRSRDRGPSLVIWLCAAAAVLFLIWAALAWVDELPVAD